MKYPLTEQATLKLSGPVDAIVERGQGDILEAVVQGMKSAHRTGRNAARVAFRGRQTGWRSVALVK